MFLRISQTCLHLGERSLFSASQKQLQATTMSPFDSGMRETLAPLLCYWCFFYLFNTFSSERGRKPALSSPKAEAADLLASADCSMCGWEDKDITPASFTEENGLKIQSALCSE